MLEECRLKDIPMVHPSGIISVKTQPSHLKTPRRVSGIYILWDGLEAVYVGQSRSVSKRISIHRQIHPFNMIQILPVADVFGREMSRAKRSIIERWLIIALQPHSSSPVNPFTLQRNIKNWCLDCYREEHRKDIHVFKPLYGILGQDWKWGTKTRHMNATRRIKHAPIPIPL